MTTFLYNEYESLCAAMAMVDATIEQLDETEADERFEWSADLGRIRNEMNDARLALLKPHGDRVWHVDAIPAARTEGGDK